MLIWETGKGESVARAEESLAFGAGGLRDVEWLEPWHPVAENPVQVAGIERELARELAAEHPLFGLPMRALARRQDCDDVLFAVEDGSGRVAVVHLPSARHPKPAPGAGSVASPGHVCEPGRVGGRGDASGRRRVWVVVIG